MSKGNWVLVALATVLTILIFLVPRLAWRLRAILVPELPDASGNLAIENVALKAELAKLQNIESQLPGKSYNYIRAIVLSRYPMNFKNEFLVDAGANQGVEKGRAVVFGGNLIGRVEKVFGDTALVKTVFDGGFEAPVRIGPFAIDALFKGGLLPQLALIPLEANINPGDIVYSASSDFPYGLAIGDIKEVKVSKDKLFREATLKFAYDLNEIKNVLIAK